MGSAVDTTAALDLYFARYFDRRDFDRGVQILREAGAIKVPLETYSLIPPSTPAKTTTAKAPPTPPTAPPTDSSN
jgi:hypothetical protein